MKPELKLGAKLIGKKSLLMFSRYVADLPDPPADCPWYQSAGQLFMHSNDTYGDCTIVAVANAIQTATGADGNTPCVLKDSTILAKYFKLTGGTDDGLVIRDVLDDWRKVGIARHKLLAHADVTPSNWRNMKLGIYLGCCLDIGWNVYSVDYDDFKAGLGFGVKKHRSRGSLEGGHSTTLAGYFSTGKGPSDFRFKLQTWAAVRDAMPDWIADRSSEVHAIVMKNDWTGPDDKAPNQLPIKTIMADVAKLTRA